MTVKSVNGILPNENGDLTLPMQPGPQGERGDRGLTGSRGITGATGQPGKDGVDGYTPIKGVDYFDGESGREGAKGETGNDGKDGEPGFIFYNSSGLVNEPIKVFSEVVTLSGNDGRFSVDISAASFTTVDSVQLTVQAGEFLQADAPLTANYNDKTSTNSLINGKAFKATSAGLLAAMQQTPAESGTKVNVLVIGR